MIARLVEWNEWLEEKSLYIMESDIKQGYMVKRPLVAVLVCRNPGQ